MTTEATPAPEAGTENTDTPAAPAAPEAPKPDAGHVPLSALEAERKARQAAEEEAKKLRDAEDKRKRDAMDESERLKLELEEAKSAAEAARQAAVVESRKSVALAAAIEAGYNHPEVAIRLVDLAGAADDEAVKAAVKAEAEKFPELTAPKPGPGQVGGNGGEGEQVEIPEQDPTSLYRGVIEDHKVLNPAEGNAGAVSPAAPQIGRRGAW